MVGINFRARIRRDALALRNALSEGEREHKSKRIRERLFRMPEFLNARIVMFYSSIRSEVSTGKLIRDAIIAGKHVEESYQAQEKEYLIFHCSMIVGDKSDSGAVLPGNSIQRK